MRTCGREDTDNGWLILALANLRLGVVVRQTVVVGGGERCGLADGAVYLREADDMLLLVVVGVHENGMLWAMLRVEFEELGDGESRIDSRVGERRAVRSLYCLHSRVVESGCAVERHLRGRGERGRIGMADCRSSRPERVYMLWLGWLPRCNTRRRLQRHGRRQCGLGIPVAADGIRITQIAWLRSAMWFAGLEPGNL